MYIKFLKDASIEIHPGTTQPFKAGDLAHLFPGVSARAISDGVASRATVEDLTEHGMAPERIPHDTPRATPAPEAAAGKPGKSVVADLVHGLEKALGV
jgi:hypothetical protein